MNILGQSVVALLVANEHELGVALALLGQLPKATMSGAQVHCCLRQQCYMVVPQLPLTSWEGATGHSQVVWAR